MSTVALNGLFEYITNSLSEEELKWLVAELNTVTSKSHRKLEPYTMEEINARIDESERQIAAGMVYTEEESDAMMDQIVDELSISVAA